MERLQLILEYRARDLVNVLVRRADLDPATAERFVSAAGADLVESWRWQSSDIDTTHLPTWGNVQRLLGGMHATSIASKLGMAPSDVWNTLRTFVPQALLMADRPSRNSTGVSRLHRFRRLERVDLRL